MTRDVRLSVMGWIGRLAITAFDRLESYFRPTRSVDSDTATSEHMTQVPATTDILTTAEPVLPFRSFSEAATAILSQLQAELGMSLWMITRVEQDDWIVLNVEDQVYGLKPGTVVQYSRTFCSRMVSQQGPRIAPDIEGVPAYAEVGIREMLPIGAYLGVPLWRADGSLFGTLCAVDPTRQPDSLRDYRPTVEIYARFLATILQHETESEELARQLELTATESETDALTGLFNRRGWERLIAHEEERCLRYGDPAGIVMVDLDELKKTNDQRGHDAGDWMLKRTADALRGTVRDSDVVARLGGDEFAVLAVHAAEAATRRLAERISEGLRTVGVRASVGHAARNPRHGLARALRDADSAMYENKRSRK